MKRFWLAVLLAIVCAVPAAAQDPSTEPDEEGCKDSKLMTRMTGCRILACSGKDFDSAELVIGKYNNETGEYPKKALEGQTEIIEYVCSPKLSPLQLARNAENAMKKAGYSIVASVREGDEHYVTGSKGAQWLQVLARPHNDQSNYEQTAVLVKEMAQELVADASGMEAAINASGSVALYGINFDTGKATIQAGSDKVLGEIAKLMKARTDWRFEVQGHTDNVGQKAANQALSEQRAAAVVGWLMQNGVAASRLVPKGYGDGIPVADNTTEEGRAKNRRVELKKLNEE